MKDHVSARAIRQMLDRSGLWTEENWTANSGSFNVSADGEHVFTISLEKNPSGHIICDVTDEQRRRRGRSSRSSFRYRDSETFALDKADRQSISAASDHIRNLAARFEREPEPDYDAIAAHLREAFAADPEEAAMRLARAIADAAGADKALEIAEAMAADPAYGT